MIRYFKIIYSNFTSKFKRKFFFLLLLSSFTSVLEFAGIGLLFPLISFFSYSKGGDENSNLDIFFRETQSLYSDLGFESIIPYYYAFLLVFLIVILISYLLRIKVLNDYIKLSNLLASHISSIILENELKKSYIDLKNQNPADTTSMLLTKSFDLTRNGFVPLFRVFTSIPVISLIIIILSIYDFRSLFFLLIFMSFYLLVWINRKKSLKERSTIYSENFNFLYKLLSESLSNTRDIILNKLENKYHTIHKYHDKQVRSVLYKNAFVAAVPRLYIELMIFIAILILLAFIYQMNTNFESVLPLLIIVAIVAQRIIPTIQQTFSAVVSIRASYQDLKLIAESLNIDESKFRSRKSHNKVSFENEIKIDSISFGYENEDLLFKNLELIINKKDFTIIFGKSGCGKSTLIDIISTLIYPQKGKIYVDNVEINKKNDSSFQELITYVPQNIFLSDDSIKNNITFNSEKKFDKKKFQEILKLTQINEFVSENKLDERIGHGGAFFSGGQKQKIALARALYNLKEILILDEATSALDKESEIKIISDIKKLYSDLTIIMITHNKNIFNFSNKIIQINNGKLTLIKNENKNNNISP
jgi:ABC-type bacteriocin/lantibiotic exporter with double-glycine peptidase domain